MDNEEEDLLDDKHFNDCVEFDDLDADAENKLLGSSDEEDNVEYEYVDEDGNQVNINENSGVEYEVVKESSLQNQNEQDVLDLEIDHDLEFDDSSVNEGPVRDNWTASAEPSHSYQREEVEEEYHEEQHQEHYEESKQISDDESESEDDEEAGRGRFRSERPNVITLTSRNTARRNIPDSLDEVLKDDGRSGGKYQKQGRRDTYDQNRFRDRNRQRDYNSLRERNEDDRRQHKSANSSQEEASSSQSSDKSWPNANNSPGSTEIHSGPRKILINPHFKGAPPVADVQNTSYWNNSAPPQTNTNYNNAYQQHISPTSVPSFNPVQYGSPNNSGLPLAPNAVNVPTSIRPPLLNAESQNTNDYQWNQGFATSAPPPHVPPPGHVQGNPTGLLDTPQMMFPPPRQRPPPVLPTDQYFNGNRSYPMRPNLPNQQWNSAPPRLNYEQYNNYGNHSHNNAWRPPPPQNQPLINNPPVVQVPKFPDLRQPPPSLQLQQPPRPVMNFSAPPPTFTNSRMDTASNSNWIGHRPPPMLGNNFSQLPPPLMGIQPTNTPAAVSLPFRLPLPTPNVPPRFMNPKMSLLGNPVVMNKQRPSNFTPRPQINMANDNMNWPRPVNIRPPGVGSFRRRTLEETAGPPMKQQRMGVFTNKQGGLVRKKPAAVNANIKEVKIIENLAMSDSFQTTESFRASSVPDNEDEETKKYRLQIELLNKKRAEILRIKEQRREIMALQRRKLLLEQQQKINNNVKVEINSEMQTVRVNEVVNPKAVVIHGASLQGAGISPAVKKRIVLRRVVATPRPPRKLTVAAAVSNPALSVGTPGAGVVPTRIISSDINPANPIVRTNVTKRVVKTSPGPANVATAQPRQLRTVVLNNKGGNNFPNQKVLTPVKSGPEMVKIPQRVQPGLAEGLNTNSNQPGQRIKLVNNAGNTQSTVLIENLSLATSEENLRKLCQSHGPVDKIELRKDNRTALVKFAQSQHAKSFADTCKRRMVDLSLISVSLVAP